MAILSAADGSWYLGGAGIALAAVMLLFLLGVQLGVSTGYGNWVAVFSRLRPFHTGEYDKTYNWRFFFLIGIVLGGFISVATSTGFAWHNGMGMLSSLAGHSLLAQAAVLFVGGVLTGFGTRWAQGCTSGHCIFGLGTWSKASWAATGVFFAVAFATSNILYRLIAGA